MFRVCKASGKYLAVDIDILNPNTIDDITTLTYDGMPIIIVDDISDLEALDIDLNLVEVVS